MPTFAIDVRLKLVSDPQEEPGLAGDVGVLLADTPAPIRACIAKRALVVPAEGNDDAARQRVLDGLLRNLPAADGWGFELRAPGHKINIWTGEWTPMANATSFVLTKDDAAHRHALIVRGARCMVEYEVCVTN